MAHVLFYDGVCGLCNRLVQFVLRRDRDDRFRFAALQSPFAARTLPAHGIDPTDLDSVYLLTDDGRFLRRGRAVLFVAGQLGALWPLTAVFRLLPTPLIDLAYRFVARRRYRWFGKHDECPVPSPETRRKLVERYTDRP